MKRRLRRIGIGVVFLLGLAAFAVELPSLGASGVLHPARRPVVGLPPTPCQNVTLTGEGVSLKGWRCRTPAAWRGTLIYLHGIADNRTSGAGLVARFTTRGFDVVAYDSRAHGESDGEVCTYGFFEKHDLSNDRVRTHAADAPLLIAPSWARAVSQLSTV